MLCASDKTGFYQPVNKREISTHQSRIITTQQVDIVKSVKYNEQITNLECDVWWLWIALVLMTQENVLRFQITVHNALLTECLQCTS